MIPGGSQTYWLNPRPIGHGDLVEDGISMSNKLGEFIWGANWQSIISIVKQQEARKGQRQRQCLEMALMVFFRWIWVGFKEEVSGDEKMPETKCSCQGKSSEGIEE